MSLWSRLFRSSAARGGVGAASQVQRLAAPTIGFLNLTGDDTQVEADRVRLAPLFARAPMSTGEVPACDVLFLYASVDAEGGIVGSPRRLRDLVRFAGARIAVLASENPPDHCLTGHVHPDCPETILLPEAGHITFDGTGSSPGG